MDSCVITNSETGEEKEAALPWAEPQVVIVPPGKARQIPLYSVRIKVLGERRIVEVRAACGVCKPVQRQWIASSSIWVQPGGGYLWTAVCCGRDQFLPRAAKEALQAKGELYQEGEEDQ